MLIGTNGFGDPDLLVAALADHTAHPMATYSEDDDSATQVVEALTGEPKWIVQITPLDRRMMSTEELVSELERGASFRDARARGLVGLETLVWRAGMSDWLPLARIEGLPVMARRLAVTRAELTSPTRRKASELVLASSALVVAVLAASVTVYVLARAGVFDAGNEQHLHRATVADSPLAP